MKIGHHSIDAFEFVPRQYEDIGVATCSLNDLGTGLNHVISQLLEHPDRCGADSYDYSVIFFSVVQYGRSGLIYLILFSMYMMIHWIVFLDWPESV